MNNVQRELFRLLCEFDDLCKENDIQYFLMGGAVLGALRNGGFLPWDDDIDIYIERSQYQKLDRILSEKLPEHRAWVTEDRYADYPNPIARYMDTETTLLYMSLMGLSVPKGMFLEFFILDPFPDDLEEQFRYKQQLWLYTELNNPYNSYAQIGKDAAVTDEEVFRDYQRNIQEHGKEPVIAELKRNITSYKSEDCHFLCTRWSRKAHVYKKECFARPIMVEFEGRQFPVGCGIYEQMLEDYGDDWDIIPVADKEITHTSVVSTDTSYLQYDAEIGAICEQMDFCSYQKRSQTARLEKFFCNQRIQQTLGFFRQRVLTLEGEAVAGENLQFHIENLEELKGRFSSLFDILFRRQYQRFHLEVPLDDDVLEVMLLVLLHYDRSLDAQYLNEQYPDWVGYQHFSQLIASVIALKGSIYGKDLPAARYHMEVIGDEPRLQGSRIQEIGLLWLKSQEEIPCTVAEIRRFTGLLRHKNDPEIRKYIGDLYDRSGKKLSANLYYVDVIETSRNGMLRHDLFRRGYLDKDELFTVRKKRLKRRVFRKINRINKQPQKLRIDNTSVLTLLGEVAGLCEQNQIRYLVGGVLPQMLYSGRSRRFFHLDLYVSEKSMKLVGKQLEDFAARQKDSRLLEYGGADGERCLYYIDRNSCYFNVNQMDDRNCLGEYIRILPYTENKDTLRFLNTNGNLEVADQTFLSDTQNVDINGIQITVPQDLASYRRILYDQNGRIEIPRVSLNSTIFSHCIPFDDVKDAAGSWEETMERIRLEQKNIRALEAEQEQCLEKRNEVFSAMKKLLETLDK